MTWSRWLVLSMVLAVALVAALGFLDETRESEATLQDLAEEQAILAASVAAEISTRLGAAARDLRSATTADGRPDRWIIEGARAIEKPQRLILLVSPPLQSRFFTTDGRVLDVPELAAAFRDGRTTLDLPRERAQGLGLPARTALAGMARVEAGSLGRWGVVVASTAWRERDRAQRARWRLVLGVLLASGLVLAFGGAALRKQRRELELAQKLELAQLRQQRDERLERTSKAATMGTLAMGIAHEISTPLGVIAGRAEQIVARVAGDERAKRSVEVILEQTERISQIIRGFLGLARGGAPPRQPVDPRAVVDGAMALVEHRFGAAGVTIAAAPPAGVPSVVGDRRLLEQALVNLLLNACDASRRGDRVSVALLSDGAHVAFEVTDQGDGISWSDAERVKEPFFTTKPAGKGTGLGLAVANEIVRSHRGSLVIEPVSPHGTRVRIELPVEEAHRGAAA